MKYRVESSYPEWHTISSSRAGHQEYDDLDVAIRALEYNSNLARCIWPMRVIDENGRIYRSYDPELDTRLPGIRWEIINRNAYSLWEAAGCPESDGVEFWLRAEKDLKEHNGLV